MKRLQTFLMCLFVVMTISLRAQEVTITLNPGTTWIGYYQAEPMNIATALGNFVPMNGDKIKSLNNGTATYMNGQWRGSLSQFTPGLGYMYTSMRSEPVTLTFGGNSSITVTTSEPTNITLSGFTCSGTVTDAGNSAIVVHGLCWGTEPNPTVAGPHTSGDFGTGSFSSVIENLEENTTYYVRAYALTEKGMVYGNEKTFSTLPIPTYTITVSANPTEGGTVSGGGGIQLGQTCTVTAIPNTGYTFVNWTENGNEVFDNATYSFIVAGARNLVANFEQIIFVPSGAINGKFAINSNGDQVYFSQGNLQYQASTSTWRFAENQYDYVGNANSNISSTYSGWIDLFGWGTSGYDHGANCYQPWSTSTSYSDYYAYGNSQYSLNSQTGLADWGYNTISNGGSLPYQWRTLSEDEWSYVFSKRSTTSGIRYAKALVSGTNGVILLPDDWNTSYYVLNNTNTYNASFSSNTITASQWNSLEQHGAIFLPAAGSRSGASDLYSVGSAGSYWSSSCHSSSGACIVHISDENLYASSTGGYGSRYAGRSVRLVRLAYNQQSFVYVDLGLPSGTLWATCNIGADSPEDYGDYFAWGVTQPKSTYNWNTYLYGNFSMTKYCFTDNLTTLLLEDDAATANWGTDWRMPTKEEWQELYNNTTVIWTTQNGVNGRLFTASNGNSLFLPAAGSRSNSSLDSAGSCGYYWSSSLNTDYSEYAWGCIFSSNSCYMNDHGSRCWGYSIRAVRCKNSVIVVTVNTPDGGEVSGGGTYLDHTNCTLTATPNEGYVFINWTENDEEVSTDATYSFAVAGNRNLVANFTASSGDDHDYVDLGLPSGALWATCNVGANAPEIYGDYFAWGETQPKDVYDWSTYQYCMGSYIALTKYCNNPRYSYNGFIDNLTTLLPEDDAATANWGSDWRMPTKEEWQELYNNTTVTWTIQNGVKGMLFTANNGNNLFLPAAGSLSSLHNFGLYWSSTYTYPNYPYYAWLFNFDSDGYYVDDYHRCEGWSVRAVRCKNSVIVVTVNMPDGGEVSGGGTYLDHTNCTVTATPNEGYVFTNWTDNGEEVSTDATYSFAVTGNRNLVANFTASNGDDHDYVDLGLPSGTLWATCNVGANAPEQYGDYFAWGETQPQGIYDWSTYQYCMGSNSTLTKYCNNSSYGYNGFTDNLTTLLPEDDAATANWGNGWRMPTKEEWNELLNNTTCTWATQNGVYGRLFTASNGNSLFLPAAGFRYDSSLANIRSSGHYLSSSLNTGTPYWAWYFYFNYQDGCDVRSGLRNCGWSVRPVRSGQNSSQTTAPTGAINGKFSINSSGDQVYFSQGNLQYQASTNTWKFAEHQYDYVGSDNSNISSTYSGWIDLFGWGTSGYDHGANCYQPWSTTATYSDYYAYGNYYWDLNSSTGQADWGYNPISNGGNQQNQWRTLSYGQWNYVINNRNTASGIRYAKAKVNNINGVILLPDDWNSSYFYLGNTNNSGATFSSNTINASQWNTLEQHGAVFLPAAGYRLGVSSISSVGSSGCYWSSSYYSTNNAYAYYMNFADTDLSTGRATRYRGQSVRLVHSVQ